MKKNRPGRSDRISYKKYTLANVITADVKATNGVIHIIDDILWKLSDEKLKANCSIFCE